MNKDIQLDQSLGFREAGLHSYLLRCYSSLGFTTPTPIQYYSLHTYTHHPTSIVAQSKSGTGKTLSYASIVLTHILQAPPLTPTCSYLVILPTRELALQVYQNFKEIVGSFGRVKGENEEERVVRQRLRDVRVLMSIGGIPFEDDRKKYLQEGGNVVVGTIGRVLELVEKKLVRVGDLRMLVLDQGDKLFQSKNRKFTELLEQAMSIKSEEGFKVQFLLYSATLTKKLLDEITSKRLFTFIQTLVNSQGTLNVTVTKDIKNVCLDEAMAEQADSLISLENIKKYKWVGEQQNCSFFNAKMAGLIQLLQQLSYLRCLVFVEKKTLLQQINERLIASELEALLIHGSLSQSSRIKLRNQVNQSRIILASDLLARGIDIELDLVILFDAKNNDTFWHRIGRTGRYNKMGVVISLDDIEGWQPYQKNNVQQNLREIELTFNKGKEWYGKYLTEVGTWNQATIQKEIEQAQEYKYFDEEKFNASKRRKEQTRQCSKSKRLEKGHKEESHLLDESMAKLLKIQSQSQLKIFLQQFLNCSQCRSFMDSVQQLTGYSFKIRDISD